MRWIILAPIAVVALAGVVGHMAPAFGEADGGAASVFGIKIPAGYRDWKVISVAQVGPPVNDVRIKLGNELAIKAYRDSKLPFPDGAIIARLAYTQIASEENNKVFRAAAEHQGLPAEQIEKLLAASSVAGPPTNVQFMVKDSRKYAATGGWGLLSSPTASPTARPCTEPALAATSPAKIATSSSPVTHLSTVVHRKPPALTPGRQRNEPHG